MADAIRVPAEPYQPAIPAQGEYISLALSVEEAKALIVLTGWVSNHGPVRKLTDSIYTSLMQALSLKGRFGWEQYFMQAPVLIAKGYDDKIN